jgi:hypothetical protein
MPKDLKNKAKVMTVGALKKFLAKFKIQNDFEIWLSSDEEGNEILPMPANSKWCIATDRGAKKVTFFPSHR